MTDRITLTGLEVFGRHGVFEDEKENGHTFLVDVAVWLDLGAAGRSDDLTDTLDYGALAKRVTAIVGGPSKNLIETLAAEVADDLMLDDRLLAAEVTIHKPSAPIPLTFADVSVTVRRTRP